MRSKLAGLLAIVAAVAVLGVGMAESVPHTAAAGSTVTTNGSGEGPNR